MSVTVDIHGIPVMFPFKPYDIQKNYMEKVIECIENETTAVLESPTGTGKTLSLLCSSLAWLQRKKAQVLAQRRSALSLPEGSKPDTPGWLKHSDDLEQKAENVASGREFLGLPTIIYASRTHSQLNQVVQEMKRTAYNHLVAVVIGSREQLCIHPEVLDEQDAAMKLHICRVKVSTRACHFNNRVETKKDSPELCNTPIIDIEDMVKLGKKYTFCPYFMTKARRSVADIVFMPYNYLLDPVARKALGIELTNSVIILDEGHNIERFCEEAASFEIKSTDIALAIDETTHVMKMISESPALFDDFSKGEDIDPEHLATLKEILLMFEKALDEVNLNVGDEITNYPGDFVFELLEKAQINTGNVSAINMLIKNIIQYLQAVNDNSPFARKGKGLSILNDFLEMVFVTKASKEKIKHCYKVHIKVEDLRKPGKPHITTWLDKGSTAPKCRILCYWCFSPGFGMELIASQGVKALILTSGTLAPLGPLISELELDVKVRLENPHIVKSNQICVKVLTKGPDGEPLNSSFRNRDNPKYLTSLGRAIVNLSRIIPNGMLIFFPSYPIMLKCQNAWETEGIWANIVSQKAIFVEPKGKDAFNAAMLGYYEKVRDPNLKGAIFMGVLRGKVSEGLDFADANGRAVIVTGLPYPPLKDPKVILKKKYLDVCHSRNKEFLTGIDWYCLEASRAVNQAIGRVIRHGHDYGAILLLDERFDSQPIMDKMSQWLRGHIRVVKKYGEIIRDLSQFFKRAHNELPVPKPKSPPVPPPTSDGPQPYKNYNFNFSNGASISQNSVINKPSSFNDDMVNKYLGRSTSTNYVPNGKVAQSFGCCSSTSNSPNSEVDIQPKRGTEEPLVNIHKRKKINLISKQSVKANANTSLGNRQSNVKMSMQDFINMVKTKLGPNFKPFTEHLGAYRQNRDIDAFIKSIFPLFPPGLRYILGGIEPYVTGQQKLVYRDFLKRHDIPVPENF